MSDESQPAELLRRGIASAKAGRKEEAREALLQVVKLDERNEQAWLWLSAVVDSNEEREICLENVLAINPDNGRARAGLEWLRQSSPPFEASSPEPAPEPVPEEDRCPRCGAGVRASSSVCPQCNLPLIVACPACGEYAGVEESACPHCGETLGDFRQGPAYHLGMARRYLEHHAAERAQEALTRVEAEAADDASALAEVGALYEEAGLRSRAIATYERALEVAPDDPSLYAHLGAVYRQHGEPARALTLYQKAEELGSQDPAVTRELARLEMEAGDAQKAVSRLHPLLRKQPIDPHAVLLMGDALQKLGDRDAAVAHYRRAVQLAPGDSDVRRAAQANLAQMGAIPARDAGAAHRPHPGRRPGCVTIYAVLVIVGALLGILGALALGALYASGRQAFQQALLEQSMAGLVDLDQFAPYVQVSIGVSLVSGLINLAIGIGLWMLKNWARIAVIVLSTLAFIAGLVQVAATTGLMRGAAGSSGFSGLPLPLLGGLVAGFVVQALIIFWFLVNRDAFD
ncbi:MAG: tetratricopeptide repeat protein [Anaerolineae bacterium]|jgi:tetratricopeptide (TPR) repeat protein|nr:tetratricopeptide repeat protein [Anaerolineae bacterium]